MSSVVISGDTSGAITLAAPAVSGTNTATLPAATGTVMVSGNMPAFSAYQNTAQTGITAYSNTKITFDVKEFDTNSNFTSSRFTPTVAGYYQINAGLQLPNGVGASVLCNLYKNGSAYKSGNTTTGNASTFATSTVCSVVYFNGSTDYVEIYSYSSNGTGTYSTSTGIDRTYFNGVLVRTA
jgi:hypothetical protein